MAEIELLSSETIDKIAAGEVVEKPLNVVKELVENSIDAGSTAITVEIKGGGIELIRVTDNGCGIEYDQCKKAFMRHATSKIRSIEDLDTLMSLGFRGEALSSICAVSKTEMITKTKESLLGTRIVVEGGKLMEVSEVGAPEGTTILIRSLFYNTPPRKKFLKTPNAEAAMIEDIVEKFALSNPSIAFLLIINGKTKISTGGNGEAKDVIYHIFGKDVYKSLLPVDYSEFGISVKGYVAKPDFSYQARNGELYFINSRFVKSKIVNTAIEEVYRKYLMQHRFPFCVLYIDLSPNTIDVNVHPQKLEVKFSDNILITDVIISALNDAFKEKDLIPEVSVTEEKEKDNSECNIYIVKSKPQAKYDNDYAVDEKSVLFDGNANFEKRSIVDREVFFEATNEDNSKEHIMKDFSSKSKEDSLSDNTSNEDALNKSIGLDNSSDNSYLGVLVTDNEPNKGLFNADNEPNKNFLHADKETDNDLLNSETVQDDRIPVDRIPEPFESTRRENIVFEKAPEYVQESLFEKKLISEEALKEYRIIGQVFDTYWIMELDNEMYIVDQHAAHEKVNYEELVNHFNETEGSYGQMINPPIMIHLSSLEEDTLLKYMEVFNKMGFEIDDFGMGSYAIRTIPTNVYGINEEEMFHRLLNELMDKEGIYPPTFVCEKLASMSCKAAIKGNQKITAMEMENLMKRILKLENPYNCPHGRPVFIKITKSEMEKKFKRIV